MSEKEIIEGSETAVPSRQQIIEEFLSSKEFVEKINTEKTNAVQNFQKEKLPIILESEFSKRLKLEEERNKKTPEQLQLDEALKRIELMEANNIAKEKERLKAENKTNVLKVLSEKKLPTDLLDFIVSDEEEKTNKNVELFTNMMDKWTTNLKEGFMSGNNTRVPGKDSISGNSGMEYPGDNASQAQLDAWYKATRNKN